MPKATRTPTRLTEGGKACSDRVALGCVCASKCQWLNLFNTLLKGSQQDQEVNTVPQATQSRKHRHRCVMRPHLLSTPAAAQLNDRP